MINDDGEDIIEETGNGIYHKLNSRENEKEETIGDQTKITKTTEEDNLTKIQVLRLCHFFLFSTAPTGQTARQFPQCRQ